MGASREQQIKAILRKIEKTPGWSWERGAHSYKIKAANGKMIFMSYTPSDHRALKNLRSWLRQAGLDI